MSQPAIKNYALIVESSPEDLVKTVTNACADGFQPIGGIACIREGVTKAQPVAVTRYAQAMVRLWQKNEHPLLVNGR